MRQDKEPIKSVSLTGGPPLRQSLTQSGAELRSFVASLRGKSPAEAMGNVAQSKLMRGMVISAAAQAVLLLAFTIPYALWPSKAPAKPAPAAANTESPVPNPGTPTSTPAVTTRPSTVASVTPGTTRPATPTGTGDPDAARRSRMEDVGEVFERR